MFEFGLGWASTGICSYPNGKFCIKNVVRVQSPFGREKSPFGREKSPAPFFSFEGYKLPEKDINSSKTQFKGIPTSFPILARKIQMTMPRPNALHGPQPKIKDIGN
jgi:hypothetical protein